GYDYPAIAARRDAVVGQLYKGVQYLMKKNKIEVVQARGRIRDRNTIEADGKLVKAKNLIVATGSTVKTLPGIALDGEYIVSSDNAVLATSVPESICIIGAGAKGVGLEQAGVQTHPNGFIKVDEWMRTSADGIHAIGDVIGGFLLAHAASHEGIVAAEDIAGQRLAPMDQNLITRCTYSHPQIAS